MVINRSKLWVFAIASFLAASCQISEKKESKKEDLSYSLEDSGCATGKVTYLDDVDLCAALKDDVRNKNCASGMRKKMFEAKGCPGGFFNDEGSLPPVTSSGSQPGSSPSGTPTPTPVTSSSPLENRVINATARLSPGGRWELVRSGVLYSISSRLKDVKFIDAPEVVEDFKLTEAASKSVSDPAAVSCSKVTIQGLLSPRNQSVLHVQINGEPPETITCRDFVDQFQSDRTTVMVFTRVPTASGRTLGRLVLRVSI